MFKRMAKVATCVCVFISCRNGAAQNVEIEQKNRGALVLCGGGMADGKEDRIGQFLKGGVVQNPIASRFVELAGGASANFVIIHVPTSRAPKDERPLAERIVTANDTQAAVAFGVKKMTALHVTDREAADSEEFAAPLQKANGVWITGGDLDRLIRECKNSRMHRLLKAAFERGGVVGGESAGAIILTKQITKNIKGVPPSVKPNTDFDEGFGFVEDIVIVPHLIRMGWQENLVPIIAAHPNVLGAGIDEGTAIVVHSGSLDVIGDSKVAIYDNMDHEGKRYYFLSAGDRFGLTARHIGTQVEKARPESP